MSYFPNSNRLYIQDDFIGTSTATGTVPAIFSTGKYNWHLSSNQGTPSVSSAASENNAPGIIRLLTGGTTGDDALLLLGGGQGIGIAPQISEWEINMRLSHTTNILVRAGLFQSTTTPGTSASYVSADTSVDAVFFHHIRRGSSVSDDVTTAVALSTVFRTWRTQSSVDGSSALDSYKVFDYPNILDAKGPAHTTGAPASVNMLFGVYIAALTSGTRFVDIDYVRIGGVELARP